MILKANTIFEATCLLRGLMTAGHSISVAVYAPSFRDAKIVVQTVINDFPTAAVHRELDELRFCVGGNHAIGRPSGAGVIIHTVAGKKPDAVICVTEAMRPDILAKLILADKGRSQ